MWFETDVDAVQSTSRSALERRVEDDHDDRRRDPSTSAKEGRLQRSVLDCLTYAEKIVECLIVMVVTVVMVDVEEGDRHG